LKDAASFAATSGVAVGQTPVVAAFFAATPGVAVGQTPVVAAFFAATPGVAIGINSTTWPSTLRVFFQPLQHPGSHSPRHPGLKDAAFFAATPGVVVGQTPVVAASFAATPGVVVGIISTT